MIAAFAVTGFAVVPDVVSGSDCEMIAASVAPTFTRARGSRSLLAQQWCPMLSAKLREHPVLGSLIPREFVATQCTYFEKSAGRNWLVPIHQDLSIPVAERIAAPELSGWSKKEGTHFVRPPDDVLAQLIAVRVHLDDCGSTDGPLHVVPGSHSLGRLSPEAAISLREARGEVPCVLARGAALVMRPLLLHSSSKASGTSLRRVLHFLFGPRVLPHRLRWQYAV